MILVVFFLIGAALAIAPWFIGQHIQPGSQIAISAIGVVVVVTVLIATMITKL